MAESPVNTPEWLLLLEKKKNRPHRLAHEIGAGSPCLVCEEKCPGLDLHFWRKLCRNCKCKKEDHDVKDDDGYEQFEILGVGARQKKLGAVLKIKVPGVSNDAVKSVIGASNKSVPFDWVPPNVTDEVAAEYMGQLPPAKLPISGSDGALYRKQQLERQMPLHDLDATRCHNLTPHEIEQLQKYLDNVKNNVVGQGRVTKVPTLYVEQRHQYGVPNIGQTSSLPLSRSEQSLKSMPPLPSIHNAVPRPFLPHQTSDEVAPPLPTTLPPSEVRNNLKTPGSFIPHNTLKNKVFSDFTSSEKYHGLDPSTTVPISNQLASDLSQLQLNRGTVRYNEGNYLPKDGIKLSHQHLSDVTHSSQLPGHAPTLSQPIQRGGNVNQPPNGSDMSGSRFDHRDQLGSGVPKHGSVVHSVHCQSVTSSVPVPGSVDADMSHPLSAKSGLLPCNCGAASLQSILSPNDPEFEPQDGHKGSGMIPKHGSVVHSVHCQSVTSSVPVPGVVGADMSHPLSPLPCNCGAATLQSILSPSNPEFGPQDGQKGTGLFPKHGSVVHSIHCQSVTSSVPVLGSAGADKSHPLSAKSGPLPCNCGAATLQSILSANDPEFGPQDGQKGSGLIPKHESIVHSMYCQSMTSSVPVPNASGADMSHPLSAKSDPLPCNCGAATLQSILSPNDPEFGPQDGQKGSDLIAKHGSVVHSVHCQSVTSSVPVPGSASADMSHPLSAKSGPLPCNCGAAALQAIQSCDTASLTSLSGPSGPSSSQPLIGQNAAHKDGSKYFPSHTGNSSFPKQEYGRTVHGGSNSAIPNKHVELQHSGEPWDYSSQMPASVRYEHALQQQYGVSHSSDIHGDSMPRSAHIIHQSRPDDNEISSLLNQPAQEQSVKSHLACHHCKENMMSGDVAVFADRAGDNTAWHPKCFVCKTCNELLVDLIYFFTKGDVYCGRHFAELLEIPRCYACDELVFVKEYTVAEGKTFHVKHFCCYECDEPLAGKQYVPVDEQPTCLDCYQEIFGKRCHTCKKQIAAGDRRVGLKDLNWHAVEECFCCHGCKKSLLGGKFVLQDQQPYCNKDCVHRRTAPDMSG